MTPIVEPAGGRAAGLSEVTATAYRRWEAGEPPDAAGVLAAHPELATHKPLVLELAYEEFCLRAEGGSLPDPVAFAARFPFADSVARLLAVHSFLGRHPSLGGGGRPTVRLQPGEAVGDLQVRRRLGRGGFADVYLVDDPTTGGRPLVLKVSARGEDEARTLGRLTHPHLMPVWGAPRVGDHRAVLTPYLGLATGDTLTDRPTGGDRRSAAWLLRVVGERLPDDPAVADPPPFPVRPGMSYERAVLHVAAAVADALRYLHAERVAHRDVKPSNLLLGPTAFPYLLDFNLATDGKPVRAGGTVAYAAPEVLAALADERTGDGINWFAADVFAFGVTVCELLLARHPYLAPTALLTATAGDVGDAAATAHWVAARLSVPSAVRRLLARCLAADPAERPTADALARGLAAAVTPPRWRRWAAVAAVGLAVATAAGGAGWRLASPDPAVPVEPAEEPPSTEPFALGHWQLDRGHPDLAIQPFLKAAESDTEGRADECLAYCYAATASYQLAAERADRAIAAGRQTAGVYANRAAAHSHRGRHGEALTDCAEALRLDPDGTAAKLTRLFTRLQLPQRNRAPLDRREIAELEAHLAGRTGLSGSSWLLVAGAYLAVADTTPDDLRKAVEAVRQARLAGIETVQVTRSRSMHERLKAVDGYEAALNEQPDATRPTDNPQLVRPVR